MSPGPRMAGPGLAGVSQAAHRAAIRLLGLRTAEGYWHAGVSSDCTLEADWILLQLWLHPPQGDAWNPPNTAQIARAAASILARQQSDGGFSIYPQGPSEASASVKAYCALKLAGVPAHGEAMARLRQRILAMGGIQAANSFVKIHLSLFNLYPRNQAATVPPELILCGQLLYRMAWWMRTILVPLSIVQALAGEGGRVPAGFTLEELFQPGQPLDFQREPAFFSWHNFFLRLDGVVKSWQRRGPRWIRKQAVHAAEKWMLARFERSDGLGAMYAPVMYSIMALDVLGYGPESPERQEAQRHFDDLLIDQPRRFQLQPSFSAVWDTALALFALGESGTATPQAVETATRWLLSKEVRHKGDWSIKRPKTEPGGWYFQFANEFYPDVDDTAMVLLALAQAQTAGVPGLGEAARRAIAWLLAMQSKDGGWAAWDTDNDWELLNHLPFADREAMLDRTCPDITGRVLEALARWGVRPEHPAVMRGVRYLLKTQERDGSWPGRWGVNYIYGTFLALRGLRAAGYDEREAEVLRGGEWLRSIQNADGGWGESCASYDRRSFVEAPSAPSQTAWAVLGLLAGGDSSSESVRRGIEYLVGTQRQDGAWEESVATRTAIPRVFYLQYHLYRDVFPVLALAEYQKGTAVFSEAG